jgi:hypothetical protein
MTWKIWRVSMADIGVETKVLASATKHVDLTLAQQLFKIHPTKNSI